VRNHLPQALLDKSVALLTAAELRKWRDDLIAQGLKPATVRRTSAALKAALNLAANLDPRRITDRSPWNVGLSGIKQTSAEVSRVISDDDVIRIVNGAYAIDPAFGLFIDVLASIGTRTSQAINLLVGDLQNGGAEAWGTRLGFPKVGADIADWSEWTPEIQARCANDILLNKRLWDFLQPDGQPPEALALEHGVAVVCDEITVTGIPFDKAAGEQRQQEWVVRRNAIEKALRAQFPEVKNWNSRLQIIKCLIAQGWEPEAFTEKTKQPKLTDEVFEELPRLFPRLTGIAEHQVIGRRLGQLANGEKSWLKHSARMGSFTGESCISARHTAAPRTLAQTLDRYQTRKKGSH
jgi:hypothetical protein